MGVFRRKVRADLADVRRGLSARLEVLAGQGAQVNTHVLRRIHRQKRYIRLTAADDRAGARRPARRLRRRQGNSGSVTRQVQVDGGPASGNPRELPEALLRVASPGCFDAMRLRLVGGRLFTRRDGTGAPRVLVVNESFAREVLGGAPAVGRRVRFAGAGSVNSAGDDVPWEIIGIVADVMYGALSATGTEAEAYAPVRQIAIRMALGARRGDVLALVVRQGAALVAAGAVVGLAAASASSRVLDSFVYGIATDDLLTFVAAPLALVAAALFACYVPARRATRIEPMEVLRFE